ncbi:MAG: hypothetical protein Q8N51_18175, partial [Gammaproteobacteria bacterium]|nr:hypothetical protein [Gammaproteobacteria bacterium]
MILSQQGLSLLNTEFPRHRQLRPRGGRSGERSIHHLNFSVDLPLRQYRRELRMKPLSRNGIEQFLERNQRRVKRNG